MDGEIERFAAKLAVTHADEISNHLVHIGLFGREGEHAFGDAGEVEQVVDDARFELDAAPEHLGVGVQCGAKVRRSLPTSSASRARA